MRRNAAFSYLDVKNDALLGVDRDYLLRTTFFAFERATLMATVPQKLRVFPA
jgi:hypothetical protein